MQQCTHFISIQAIAKVLGPTVCSALLGLHAFMGCDTTSCFVGKGKEMACTLMSTPQFASAMAELGRSWPPPAHLQSECEVFTCALYNRQGTSVNDLRYELFCFKLPQCYYLPPTQDALRKHVSRACYQATIWRRVLRSIDWLSQLPAPEEILELIACGCQSEQSCTSARCNCKKNNLPCTDCCRCIDCANPTKSSVGMAFLSTVLDHYCKNINFHQLQFS